MLFVEPPFASYRAHRSNSNDSNDSNDRNDSNDSNWRRASTVPCLRLYAVKFTGLAWGWSAAEKQDIKYREALQLAKVGSTNNTPQKTIQNIAKLNKRPLTLHRFVLGGVVGLRGAVGLGVAAKGGGAAGLGGAKGGGGPGPQPPEH